MTTSQNFENQQADILWEGDGVLGFGIRSPVSHYIIYTNKVVEVSGLFSRNCREVQLHKISAKEVHQGLIDRIFGTGTVSLITRGHDIPDIHMRVHSPFSVLSLIEKATHDNAISYKQSLRKNTGASYRNKPRR